MGSMTSMSASTLPFLRTLCHLRWWAIAGQLLTVAAVTGPMGLVLERAPLYGGIAALAIFNLVATLRTRHARSASNVEAFIHLLVDIAALAWLAAWSGGLANPFASLLVMPLALATLALPQRWVAATAAACVAAYAAVATFGHDLPHVHGGPAAGFNLHLWGMAVNFLVMVGVVLYFSMRLVGLLRQRERELADLRERFVRNEGIVALATHAASVAHELNTPLGTLTLLADDLLDSPLPADSRDDVATMRQLLDVCRERVRELARPADHAQHDAVDLEQTIARWQLVRPEVTLHREGPSGATPRVDPGVGHLLLALLNNAADAGLATGSAHVDLSLRIDGNALAGSVRDHGAGFDPDRPFLPELFQSGKANGMGVGLALSHATIERLGGDLWVESSGAKGSCVRFRVPLAPGTTDMKGLPVPGGAA